MNTGLCWMRSRMEHDCLVQCGDPASGKKLYADGGEYEWAQGWKAKGASCEPTEMGSHQQM